MKISRYIIGLALVASVSWASAQQVPLYGQYYFNKFMYNPAMTGQHGGVEAYLTGRRQWTAVEGYQTRAMTLSGAPQGKNVGLGVHFVNDRNQLAVTNSVYGSYAYRITTSETSNLALGFSLGAVDQSFNMNNIIVTDQDDATLALLSQNSGPVADMSLGMAYTVKGLQLGVSFPQLFNSPIIFKDNYRNSIDYNLQSHYIASASYDIKAGNDFIIQPMVMYKGTKNAPGQIDANLMIDWQHKAWLGASYREDYAVTMMAGANLAKTVRLGYAYDWSIGGYSTALGGSHELILGLVLDRQKTDSELEEEKNKFTDLQEDFDEQLDERDSRIAKLEEDIKNIETAPNRVDTVVVVKKIESVVRHEVPVGSGSESTGGTGSSGSVGSGSPSAGSGNVGSGSTTPSTPGSGSSTQPASKGDFIVVAGSFQEEANATIYFNQLVRKGQSPYVYYDRNRRSYYVHLGSYTDKDLARAHARKGPSIGLSLWVKTLK